MNAFKCPCLRTPSISIIAPNEPSTAVIILLNLYNKTIPLIHQVNFLRTTKRGMNLKIKSPFLNLTTWDWSSFSVSKNKNVSISDVTSPIYRKKHLRYTQQQHFFHNFSTTLGCSLISNSKLLAGAAGDMAHSRREKFQ